MRSIHLLQQTGHANTVLRATMPSPREPAAELGRSALEGVTSMLLTAWPHVGMIPVVPLRSFLTCEVNAMSITRREALAAAVGCGLMTTVTAGADDKPAAPEPPKRDPIYSNVPDAIRKVFDDTFPNHRCIRMVTRGEKDATVYRATVFNPADLSVITQLVDGGHIMTPPLYHLELDATGKVLEETRRPVLDLGQLPKAVVAAHEKWNAKGVKGMALMWSTQVPRGKDRVYGVFIIVNSVTGYSASFKADGTVLKADPAVVP
jgi:hypothetical protein